MQGYLDERRDLTANLEVNGPRYLPVKVTAKIVIWKRAKESGVDVRRGEGEHKEKIRRFLHPTRGGPDGRGWQVGQHVFVADLFKAIMPPEDIGYIELMTITSQ